MNSKKSHFFIMMYAFGMLAILLALSLYLLSLLHRVSTLPVSEKTEYIYVSEDPPALPEQPSELSEESGWIVKEHMGKIGIFESDGTLVQIIDTYVKTLPNADQELLGEGLKIVTQAELNAIIEDYSD